MAEQTAMQKSVKSLLGNDAYKKRFEEVLKNKAPQFMASLSNLVYASPALQRCRSESVVAAAFIAASLDLPIDRNLGFAWIIPYGELATFQLGYKAYIQLALRTGQYERMNAVVVNAEAFKGYDAVGEAIIDWSKLDVTKPAVGYAVAWKLVTGFTKVVYWPKEKITAHAKKYSQAFKQGKKDSPWFTDFDKMGLKTVIANALRLWGIMSVEIQQAIKYDQTAQYDVDSEPIYPDCGEEETNNTSSRTDRLASRLKKPEETRKPAFISREQVRELIDGYERASAIDSFDADIAEFGCADENHITIEAAQKMEARLAEFGKKEG